MTAPTPHDVHRQFAAALNAGDLDAVCALYEPEATIMPQPGQEPIHGIDGIRRMLESFIRMKTQIDIEVLWLVESGDIALVRSQHRLIGVAHDGSPIEMLGSGSAVLRRQPDGNWRYVIDHPWGAG